MDASLFDAWGLKTRFPAMALTLAVMGHAVAALAQQTTTPPGPAAIDTATLRPGMRCHVSVKTPLQPDHQPPCNSSKQSTGTIEKVTRDEIVVHQIVEGRNERKTPILGALPYFGKYFTRVEVGRADFTVRIPVDKIAKLEVLEPEPVVPPRR